MNLHDLKNYDFNSVLDIGAHHGNFYRELSNIKNISKWLLIEANQDCCESLNHTGVPYCIHMLSDVVKTIPYYRHKYDKTCTGNSYYRELSHHYVDGNIEVQQITTNVLDNVVSEVFDFIKVDTQGSELDILRGGAKTMMAAKFILLETSIRRLNAAAPLQPEVVEFMAANRFYPIEVIDELKVGDVHQQDILFAK